MQDKYNRLIVATFQLKLTPFQSLILANQHKTIFKNLREENTAFLKLIKSPGKFILSWKADSFSVIKVRSKQLSCYGKHNFQSHEYNINEKDGSIVVNKTGKQFSLSDYTLVEKIDEKITLCRKLVLSDCKEGAYMPLNASEYVTFLNFSVYHNTTGSIFNFGKYLVDENNLSNITNTNQSSTLPKNARIAVCLPFENTFNITATKYSNCSEGAYILLNASEYAIFPNLSVFYNTTGSIFNFGEYIIGEDNEVSNISNSTPNTTLAWDPKIAVCLPFKNTFNITVTNYRNSTETTNYGLQTLTIAGFIVSIIC